MNKKLKRLARKSVRKNARDGIRTQELLRDQALNLAPLTWLGYPRACIDYSQDLINVGERRLIFLSLSELRILAG